MSSPPPSLPTELAFLSLFPPSDSDDGSDNEFESEAPKKLSSREERIQRAIEEGKKAYGWDQAETRFGWYADDSLLSKKSQQGKIPQKNKVFLAQSLYARRLYAECLALCKELLAIDGFDERDVTDMALRCCKRLGDGDSGEELARHCRSKWITTPYLAYSSAEAFLLKELYSEALKAILCAISSRSLQHPYLVLLARILHLWSPTSPSAARLSVDATRHADRQLPQFSYPIFGTVKSRKPERHALVKFEEGHEPLVSGAELDRLGHELGLDTKGLGRLQAVWGKLSKVDLRAAGGEGQVEEDEDEDGGVRCL